MTIDWLTKLKDADKELRSERQWHVDWSEDAVRDHHEFFLRIGRDEQHCTHPVAPFLALSRNIWPQIVAVIEAAEKAAEGINDYYMNMSQSSHEQTIHEDSHSLWFHRDEVQKALAALKAKMESQ